VAYEDAGVDVLTVPEAYGVDAVSGLGFLAAATSRVELMAAILPIYSRTPTLLAMSAAGLDVVSGGRFSLGLGVSGPQVVEGWHGVRYDAPLGRTREVMQICRTVWRREPLTHQGRRYEVPLPPERGTGVGKPLKLVHRPPRPDIPIYLAALGPANVELAAAEATGWIPFFYLPERAHLVWGDALARGTAKRDDARERLEIVAGGPFAVGAGLEHLREEERSHLALYVGGMGPRDTNFYNRLVGDYGWEAEAAKVQDLYFEGRREEAAAAVPDGLVEGTTLVGDLAYLRDRLEAYSESGVTVLQVTPVGADPVAELRVLAGLAHDM
jgi:F420-dependent oxidoreductase-like protein